MGSGVDEDERPFVSWTSLRECFKTVARLTDGDVLEEDKATAERLRSGFNLLRVYSKTTARDKEICNENIDQLDVFVQEYKV